MTTRRAAIILAAGKSTRMKSARSKVLHPVGGRPMIDWVTALARGAGVEKIVEILRGDGKNATVVNASETEVLGVNDRTDLAAAEAAFQAVMRDAAMTSGVSLKHPDTVFFAYDTVLEPDVTIDANVVFGPGVTVRRGATIHAFSHLEGADVGEGASIGPFARIRPGTKLSEGAKVGNFVETKNANIGKGSKINHLSYVGDADLGANVNVGAGTITCNYDGYNKHKTTIRDGAFVGSNSSLVAPVTIGAGAFLGSGGVVTEDVPDDALALARSKQVNKDGWGARFRAVQEKLKAKKT